MGAGSPGRQVESFNLDTVINGEHVLLACEDDKECEAPALGNLFWGLEEAWTHASDV
jgi:hypothetical protein